MKLEAGAVLDRIVHEAVFHSAAPTVVEDAEWLGGGYVEHDGVKESIAGYYPPYSTDISAAWQVVEKMKERHSVNLVGGPNDEGGCEGWSCMITAIGYRTFQDNIWTAEADTAPLAISRASLLATQPASEVRG